MFEVHVDFHVKCLLFLPCFNQNWNMLTDLGKTVQY